MPLALPSHDDVKDDLGPTRESSGPLRNAHAAGNTTHNTASEQLKRKEGAPSSGKTPTHCLARWAIAGSVLLLILWGERQHGIESALHYRRRYRRNVYG